MNEENRAHNQVLEELAAMRQRINELEALQRSSLQLTSSLDLSTVLDAIAESALALVGATDCVIYLYDPARQRFSFGTASGRWVERGTVLAPRPGGLTATVVREGRPVVIDDVAHHPLYASPEAQGWSIQAIAGFPLRWAGRALGVLHVVFVEPHTFNEQELRLLGLLADQAAIAVENSQLYAQAQQEISERVQAAEELRKHRDHLEELVDERTAALTEANALLQREIAERERAEAELRKSRENLEERVKERTTELRESEERYRSLFDGVPVGLYRSTPGGELVDANLALVEMLGYPSREDYLEIDSATVYVNPQDRMRWQTLMEREGVVRDFEARLRRHDGTVIWANDTARVVKDEKGQVLYYEGSLEDVSERKQAENELRRYQEHLEELVEARTAELRESEERYRTLFDGVPVGLYRTTPQGQVLDINRAFVEMAGYPDREALQVTQTTSFYVDPEEQVRWRALMEREGVVRDFEARMRQFDGTVRWVNDTARAVKDEQGRVLYYEGSLEDITERKRFEGEIRRQKEYYEALFLNNPVAVVTIGRDGNIVSWNPAAERLFGYTQAEAIGRNVDELVANDDAIRAEAIGYTETYWREGYTGMAGAHPDVVDEAGRLQVTTRRTRKDGSLVDVVLQGLPVIVGGEEAGVIAIYNDISELQKARREAEAANQAKSTFLANMSHELRTPLNAILGFSQLMDGDPNLTAEQQENLEIINRSGEHLLALINDVLEMSKIEAGRVALQETSFDLYDLLDSLEEMFRLRAEARGLTLSLRRADNVPRFVVTDEGKLRQVLSNLLGNAVKFTREGGVALRVSLPSPQRSHPQARQVLYFEVEDTGPGIAPQDLETVFEPFVQAAAGQEPQQGTGLGLSISRQFVRLMGGDITARSELGRGSLFLFDVQVRLADAAELAATGPRQRVLGLAPDQRGADGRPLRLLVVEDRETNRRLLVKLLESLGFQVREATNGQEALEVWERWQPHLIWMDMRMPVMDGRQATQRIKATLRGQGTVIIALTATAFEENREQILLEGCDDFVRKPFRKEEIYAMLAKHLGVRFLYEEAPAPAPSTRPGAPAYGPSLATMPPDWLADLRQATIRADLPLILRLVDQIREQDADLADALADLARNYEYKQILTLIEQAGG